MRKVTVIGSAAALTLVAALPAAAILPTDTIISPTGGAQVVVGADDGGGGGGAPTSRPTSRPTGDPATPVASKPVSKPVSAKPLTAEQKRQTKASGAACAVATSAIGSTPDACKPAAPGATVVPAGQQPARPRVTVAQVRQRAVDQIKLTKPDLRASPCLANAANCTGTVGVPVWLWIGEGAGGLPSETASATAGTFTINATAKVNKVKWSLGDGQSTTCSGTGTVFNADEHGWSAPDCGFKTGWKNAGTYTLTASYVWEISWNGDQTGSATQTMTSTQQINVREIQTVVSGHED